MKKILVLGAGRSSTYLISHLAHLAGNQQWKITIADMDENLARQRAIYPHTSAMRLDISVHEDLELQVQNHDLVVSLLPAHLHLQVAKLCLSFRKNLCTASYLTEEMKAMDAEVKKAGLIFLNELGLDPGIDHMSAVQLIQKIKSEGCSITEFESFTGGLVAPESDNNPWNYKFTWNPRNVVLAGQGGAVKFIQNGMYKFIPYHKLFRRTEIIDIDEFGKFEGYANRDSLKYRETYGLEDVETMYRGTLRRPGFCRAWDLFVQLGATDDSYVLPNSENLTNRNFINTFLAYNITDSVEIKLRQYLKIDQDDVDLWEKLQWLGIFDRTPVKLTNATPAMVLEHILKQKLTPDPQDKDMIVMWHKIKYYDMASQAHEIQSSMVCIGEGGERTAMSKTVGLPLAMGCQLILDNKIQNKGTILPITKDIYGPILHQLDAFGIRFSEKSISA